MPKSSEPNGTESKGNDPIESLVQQIKNEVGKESLKGFKHDPDCSEEAKAQLERLHKALAEASCAYCCLCHELGCCPHPH